MKDCCIESSNTTNGLLDKAYQQAKQMDPDATTGWFDWVNKKSLQSLPEDQESNMHTADGWFDRFSTIETTTSQDAQELHAPKLTKHQMTVDSFSKRFSDIMCSEELTYFIGGMSFGLATGYLIGMANSTYKAKIVEQKEDTEYRNSIWKRRMAYNKKD